MGFDYLLDGAPVEHTPECGFTGTPIEEENCIQEGMLDVRLKMLDTRGDELPDPFSPFLYPDKFIVELYPEDKSERVVLQGSGLTYQYQGAVDQKKYVMQIQTPWNEVLNQTIDVLEKRKPLEIMPVSSEIVVDDVSGERRLLTVQVNEGGEPISEANAGYVDINCVCDDEGLLVERQAAQLDGRWSFLVTLKDPSQHQIAETALFHLTAVRNYSKGGPTEWTQDVELPLTSDPHTMEIQYEEETVIRAVCNLLTSQPIAIDYCCDGELLTDEQRQNLVVELTEGDQAARKFIRVDDDGSLLIRRSLHWWNMSEEALSAVLMVKYTKYNRACEETFSISFAVKPIGTVLKVNVVAGAVLLLGWVLGCIIKCCTPVHIKKREFFLKKEGRGVPYKLKLGRRRNLFLPFWQKATLSLKQSLALGGVEPMPGIKLEIRNRPGGDGFILCNWQDFTDAERFRIGNLPISEQNSIFSSSRRFSLKNGFGEFVNLSIEERDRLRYMEETMNLIAEYQYGIRLKKGDLEHLAVLEQRKKTLGRHMSVLENGEAVCRQLVVLLGEEEMKTTPSVSRPSINFMDDPNEVEYYWMPYRNSTSMAEINGSGDMVNAFFNFVSKVTLRKTPNA